MGGVGSSETYHKHVTRLLDPIHRKTPNCTSNKRGDKRPRHQGDESDVEGDSVDASTGGARKSNLEHRIHLADVSGPKGRWGSQADFQPTMPERIPPATKVSPLEPAEGPILLAEERLPGKNRSLSGLSPCTRKARPPQVPLLILRRPVIQHNVSTVRAINGTRGFRQDFQLDSRGPSTRGNESGGVFGRLFGGQPGRQTVAGTNRTGFEPSPVVGLGSKRAEVGNNPNAQARFLGYHLGYPAQRNGSTYRQKGSDLGHTGEAVSIRSLELGSGHLSAGKVELRSVSRAPGATLLSAATARESPVVKVDATEDDSPGRGQSLGLSVVEDKYPPDKTNLQVGPRHFPDNGCITDGLGIPVGGHSSGGSMVRRPDGMAHQPERALHRQLSDSDVQGGSARQIRNGSVGQQNDCCLHQEPGGNPIKVSARCGQGAMVGVRPIQDPPCPLLPSRNLQHPGGQTLEKPANAGLAPEQGSEGVDIQQMGYPGDRPFCNLAVQGSSKVCDVGCQGPGGGIYKCLQQDVAGELGVDFPAAPVDAKDPSAPKRGAGDVLSGSAEVGKDVLEGGFEEEEPGSPISAPESRATPDGLIDGSPSAGRQSSSFRGLEGTGWSTRVKGLAGKEVELLGAAWRDSSWKSYTAVWRQWLKWCKAQSVPSDNPSAQNLVSYLSFLFHERNLAFSTILMQKSVICTLSNAGKGESLSTDPLVKSLLKAVGIQRAKKRKPPESRIWNVKTLTSWMSEHPPEEDSIFQVSRFTALQLLLASGRRIHDLTLLSINPENCVSCENEIILWPRFGSKTDRGDYQQSGWKITRSEDADFDLVAGIQSVITLSAQRREASPGLTHLFITTRGTVKAASRAVIAGWIRTAFTEAGIQSSPGSIRSAVASSNFQNKMCMDELLRRGNWRGATNFFKHYCKEVDNAKVNEPRSSITRSFDPV